MRKSPSRSDRSLNTDCCRYEYSHTVDRLWRKNRNPNPLTLGLCPGVDLNRNFGYKWAHEVKT